MTSKIVRSAVAFTLVAFSSLFAQPNGGITESTPYSFPEYVELPAWMKRKYTPDSYHAAFGSPSPTKLTRIKYTSDGLLVAGFIYQPATTGEGKAPVIVYNRPGVGEAARIGNENFWLIYEMHKCVESGFIVIASQYRGIDGGQGKDEVGGSDVHDVMNLLPIIKTLKHANLDQIFLWGSSRGGSMALQALKAGFPARAVTLVGAVTDWEHQLKHSDRVARESWPDFENRKQEHIAERSAIQWVDQIPNVPILILQGGNDNSVDPEQALQFGRKLNEAGKLFELKVVANEDHLLTQNLDMKINLTLDWFKNLRLASIAKTFDRCNRKDGIEVAIATYLKLKETSPTYYDFSESELNYLGYSYLFGGHPKDAITVFKLNTQAYPSSSSAWDSLAEAYQRSGDKEQAASCYQKVLALDPGNKAAADALKKIKG